MPINDGQTEDGKPQSAPASAESESPPGLVALLHSGLSLAVTSIFLTMGLYILLRAHLSGFQLPSLQLLVREGADNQLTTTGWTKENLLLQLYYGPSALFPYMAFSVQSLLNISIALRFWRKRKEQKLSWLLCWQFSFNTLAFLLLLFFWRTLLAYWLR